MHAKWQRSVYNIPPSDSYADIIKFTIGAMGCMVERQFYHWTGKKVGGWTGRIWGIFVLTIGAYPVVKMWVNTGWSAVVRATFDEDGGFSLVEFIAERIGLGEVEWDGMKRKTV